MSFNPRDFKTVERTKLFPWKHGISVELQYTSKAALESTVRNLTPSRGVAQVPAAQAKLSRRALYRACFRNWSGATVGHFRRLAGLDIPADQLNTPLLANEENVIAAFELWFEFEEWVLAVATDPAAFEDEPPEMEEERLGN